MDNKPPSVRDTPPPPYPAYSPYNPYTTGPPQQAYSIPLPQRQGQQNIVVTIAPQFPAVFGPHPQPTTCPQCHKFITTRVFNDPTFTTHMLAALCCIFCCMPCIPYCMDSCQNRSHYCPSCTAFLGTYSRQRYYR